MYHNTVWVPSKDLQLEVISSYYNGLVAGHPGICKTKELICRDYNWKGLVPMVKSYVKTCNDCIRNKPSRQKPQGLFKPLQIPDSPWSSISIDFIVKLPKSNGYDLIMVVVDCFTKFSTFIPCTTRTTAREMVLLANWFVFSKHGFPWRVISD